MQNIRQYSFHYRERKAGCVSGGIRLRSSSKPVPRLDWQAEQALQTGLLPAVVFKSPN